MFKDHISKKANRLLTATLAILILIAIRVLILTTIQRDYYVELSKKPQHKTIIEPANRGTIEDRHGIPLTSNEIQYNAAIVFDEMRQVPKIHWKDTGTGKREKRYARRDYIERLSALLGEKLQLDPLYIEDIIYSHASIFPNTPFTLKEGIDQKTYNELRMLERQWPGLKGQIAPKRTYPQGKTGCHIAGYMGAINQREHLAISSEIKELKAFLKKREEGLPEPLPARFASIEAVQERLAALKEKSYTINSSVGKTGIEKIFDKELRGYFGKKKFEVDTTGHMVRELPDSYHSTPGNRFSLNISAELQAYAEELLAQSEQKREERFQLAGKHHNLVHSPWIKGGSIIAMVPDTGEILALASYPRFDPNDFIYSGNDEEKKRKSAQINKWLETPRYIQSIWDGKANLERECFSPTKGYYIEAEELSWERYIDMILSKESHVKLALHRLESVEDCLQVQSICYQLLELSDSAPFHTIISLLYPQKPPFASHLRTDLLTLQYTQDRFLEHAQEIARLKDELALYIGGIKHNDDKLLFLDLCRLVAPFDSSLSEIKSAMGELSLSRYRALNQAFSQIESHIRPKMEKLFHEKDFLAWRKSHFKSYLKGKRKEEKEAKRYQKPYLDYLQAKEDELFEAFYAEKRWELISAFLSHENPTDCPYIGRSIEISKRGDHSIKRLKELKEYVGSLPFRARDPLLKSFQSAKELSSPLWGRYFLRRRKGQTLKELAMHFYPITGFGYSRSYAFQEAAPLGSIFKIVTAYEALNQKFSPENPEELNPLTIVDCSNPKAKERSKQVLGYHEDGSKITRIYRGGRLPASYKRTGKVDFLKAFEHSSNIYFSLLASDILRRPADLTRISRKMSFGDRTGIDLPGEIRGILPTDIMDNRTGLYAFAIGQHSLVVTPLQAAVMMSAIAADGKVLKPQIVQRSQQIQSCRERKLNRIDYPYKSYINAIGLDLPFFTETLEKEQRPLSVGRPPVVKNEFNYPKEVKNYLMKGLHSVVNGERGSARPMAIRALAQSYQDKRRYNQMRHSMVGKTATAEILYRPCLDRQFKPIICKHVWFSSASFDSATQTKKPNFDAPEIVVIVYLRFGDYGKEAAPIASKIIDKFREITRQSQKVSLAYHD